MQISQLEAQLAIAVAAASAPSVPSTPTVPSVGTVPPNVRCDWCRVVVRSIQGADLLYLRKQKDDTVKDLLKQVQEIKSLFLTSGNVENRRQSVCPVRSSTPYPHPDTDV